VQLVMAVQQLAECCATLDHAVRAQQARIDQLEASATRQPRTDAVPLLNLRPASDSALDLGGAVEMPLTPNGGGSDA
jgi:hypothetical protein